MGAHRDTGTDTAGVRLYAGVLAVQTALVRVKKWPWVSAAGTMWPGPKDRQ